MGFTKFVRTNFWLLIALFVLLMMFYFVFVSSPIWMCVCGLIIAIILFLLRQFYQKLYGVSEVIAGLFILYHQGYPQGRGAFSSGFDDGFQTFRWNIVLISTVGAVYIMVRGFDNILNPRRK